MSGEKPQLDNYVVWGTMVEESCRQAGKGPKANPKYDKWVEKLEP